MAAQASDTSQRQNAVERILDASRRVGNEYCWPGDHAPDVARALGEVGQAILGFELWAFDDELTPRVVAVSDYRLQLENDWSVVVADSVRCALEALRSVAPPVWVNFTWASAGDVQRLTASDDQAE